MAFQVAAADVGGVEPDAAAAGQVTVADGQVQVDLTHDEVVFGKGWE